MGSGKQPQQQQRPIICIKWRQTNNNGIHVFLYLKPTALHMVNCKTSSEPRTQLLLDCNTWYEVIIYFLIYLSFMPNKTGLIGAAPISRCRESAVNSGRRYLPDNQFMKPVSQNSLIAKQTCILFSCSPSLTRSLARVQSSGRYSNAI